MTPPRDRSPNGNHPTKAECLPAGESCGSGAYSGVLLSGPLLPFDRDRHRLIDAGRDRRPWREHHFVATAAHPRRAAGARARRGADRRAFAAAENRADDSATNRAAAYLLRAAVGGRLAVSE